MWRLIGLTEKFLHGGIQPSFFCGVNRLERLSAPLAEAMQKYSSDGASAFHTPGHKQGLGAHELLKNLITAEGLRQEVSLMEELDDLHSPHSCISAAEILAAKLWHADHALFIINGTTCAIQTMILATLKAGDLVFVPRNSHRSVMSGLILAGAIPIFLPIDFSADLKIPLNLTVTTLRRAINKFPNAKGLIATSPNYYGVATSLSEMADILHAAGMLLLVDEAHGAHLQFSEDLPKSAMDSGSDMSAQSTHKLLGAMTQASMLMVNSERVDIAKVRRAASLLQSTSPNYLLLASLDIARLQMTQSGREKIAQAINLSQKLRSAINNIDGLSTFDAAENFALDLTKVTVNVERLGLTGIDAERILRHEFKVQCELSDASNLLFLITYADTNSGILNLIEALNKLSARRNLISENKFNCSSAREIVVAEISPREIFFAENKAVPINKSAGKICAEEITFYPPGIPIINLGERITSQAVEYIREMKNLGGRIIGAADTNLNTIKVVI